MAETASQLKPDSRYGRRSLDMRTLEDTTRRISLHVPIPPMPARERASSDAGSSMSGRSGRVRDALDEESSNDRHIYLPIPFEGDVSANPHTLSGNDVEELVMYRNFFAFLTGGSLVSTLRNPSIYAIFMGVATLLHRFEFTNLEGSTYGDTATDSFDTYCDELGLGYLREGLEKTIEAIVLGESMKSWSLFNEGFVHATGRLDDIKSINSHLFNSITTPTRNKLERAKLDLDGRLQTVETKLVDFEFPSLFAGVANSSASNESKDVRFKAWKTAFARFSKHVLTYYRHKYGSWPPKANSKGNSFTQGGLNRLVLL